MVQTMGIEYQSKLSKSPTVAIAGFFCDCFAASVVSVARDLVVFGPCGNRAESSQSAGNSARLVALHDYWRNEPRVGLIGVARRQVYPQFLLDPLGTLGWSEICTHGSSLAPMAMRMPRWTDMQR
jgi:hypothetical protein